MYNMGSNREREFKISSHYEKFQYGDTIPDGILPYIHGKEKKPGNQASYAIRTAPSFFSRELSS